MEYVSNCLNPVLNKLVFETIIKGAEYLLENLNRTIGQFNGIKIKQPGLGLVFT